MRSSMTKLRSTKKFEIVLDSNKLKWFYMSCAAALPQLDRGSDYESERHRFESYTPHQLKSKASGNGGFSFTPAPHGFEPRSRRGRKADDFLSTRVRFRVGVAAHPRPLLLSTTDQGDISWQSVRHTSSGFSIPRSAFRRCPSSLRDAHMAWSGNSLARISMNLVMSSNSSAKGMCRFWAT